MTTDPALGSSSDFGWQTCHGCEKMSDRWGDPKEKHMDGCPGVCVRTDCGYHNPAPRASIEEIIACGNLLAMDHTRTPASIQAWYLLTDQEVPE